MNAPGNTDNEIEREPDSWTSAWAEILECRLSKPAPLATASWNELDRSLFELYKPLIDARLASGADRSFVLAQLGQSLDGCIATASGDSCFVTGPESLRHLHRLRALSDVVLVGAGTVAADNPKLTTRRVPGPHPVRAVLDPSARLDGCSGVFTDGKAPTLWLCDQRCAEAARARLSPLSLASTLVLGIDGLQGASGFDPARVVETLASRGLRRIFLEGGGVTVSRFLAAGALDRLHLVVAPVLIGTGKPGLALPPWTMMRDCPRLPAKVHRLGEDVLWDLDLRHAQPAILARSVTMSSQPG